MQAERIAALLKLLTPEQRQEYEQLLSELTTHGGDLSKLSAIDQQTLADLTHQMNPDIQQESIPDSVAHTADVSDVELAGSVASVPSISPTTTPFGQYVAEQLATLTEGGSSLADAVRYSFHNKYLPVGLKDQIVSLQVYQRYQLEIDEITAKMQAVNQEQPKEARVLVGLAWFSMLYQCYQYVEAYGDLH